MTSIPYFREVILMSFGCLHCGHKSNEVKVDINNILFIILLFMDPLPIYSISIFLSIYIWPI